MDTAASLRNLTATLLESEGAAVQTVEPCALEVVAPPHLQDALGLSEWGRLSFGPDGPPDAQRVSLESDLVEGMERVLGDRGRHARVHVAHANPAPRSPERVLQGALAFDNATYRLHAVAPAQTTYVIPIFKYVARSDDQREGLMSVAINAATGSIVDDLGEMLDAAHRALVDDRRVPAGAQAWALAPDDVAKIASLALPARIRARLGPFLEGMRRRLQRDTNRLYDYHSRLRTESLARLDKLLGAEPRDGAQEAVRREELRLSAIASEYAAKLEDLRQRFALLVEVEWVQTLEVVMPVQRFDLELRRRKSTRPLRLDLNPLTRRLEAPACPYRYVPNSLRKVCDDALHTVSLEGFAACPDCDKPSCHACHPDRCPSCGRERDPP